MKITILGSGTSTGVPMVGCSCPVCSSTDPKDNRTRASLLVEHEGKFLLVDTSTDFRSQALRENIPKIDAVLFTHAHADHVHGIDDLRGFHFLTKNFIPCFASKETMEELSCKFDYIFTGLASGGYHKLLEAHVIDSPFELFGLTITPIPLMHGSMPATGFRFGDVAYLTDCSTVPDSSMKLLTGLDTLIIDGLRHTRHPHHFNINDAIMVARQLSPKKTLLTHLTHEVSHGTGTDLPAGVYFAFDGLNFEV